MVMPVALWALVRPWLTHPLQQQFLYQIQYIQIQSSACNVYRIERSTQSHPMLLFSSLFLNFEGALFYCRTLKSLNIEARCTGTGSVIGSGVVEGMNSVNHLFRLRLPEINLRILRLLLMLHNLFAGYIISIHQKYNKLKFSYHTITWYR